MVNDPQNRDTFSLQGDEPPLENDFDQANQSLADALRKSFRVLKLLMVVMVVLYFLSGWFSIKPNESGVVMRFGRIVGIDADTTAEQRAKAVLEPGWKWSWPFPIDHWQTVAVNEREMHLEFMLQLTKKEHSTGKIERKYSTLAPERDDYLVTGDVNILHASLVIKYHITNVIDYITHVHPQPDPKATVYSKPYKHYPEYTILRNLARDAVIETAAGQEALKIRGNQQSRFLLAVAENLNRRLKALDDRGTPLGIQIDPFNGVIAPKGQTGTLEAIMPPRQTQEAFDQVFSAQAKKASTISKAQSEARALLVTTAGEDYQIIADAIEQEFDLLTNRSMAKSMTEGDMSNAEGALSRKESLEAQGRITEKLLVQAGGDVRSIVKNAEIERNKIVKEALGDYNQLIAVLPEYQRNPDIFIARLLSDAYTRALSNDHVVKIYVPPALQYRLHIPRSSKSGSRKKKEEKKERLSELEREPPELVIE